MTATLPDSIMSLAGIGAGAVFFAVLALSLAVATVASRTSSTVQARLSRHAVRVSAQGPQRLRRVEVLSRTSRGATPQGRSALVQRLGTLARIENARRALVHADIQLGVGRYFLIRLLVAAMAFAVAQVVFGILAAGGAALVGFMLPRVIIGQKGSRRRAAFENHLAETLDLLVGSLRAGQGLLQAVESASDEQPEPMRSELRRIVSQVNMGVSMTDAMETLTTRFDSRDVDLLAAAIAINRETGGNLTEVLERLAKTVRQRREIRAEAKSLTAAPRATGYILAVLPFLITGYSVAISPIYREQLLHAPLGRMLLIGAIVWSLVGFFISQKLAKAEY